MNEIFHDMQEQMTPGPEAADSLRARLEGAVPARKRRPVGIYAAVAACAALAIAAWPVYKAAAPNTASPALHSYVLAAGAGEIIQTVLESGPAMAGGAQEDMGVFTTDAPAAVSSVPAVDWDAEVEPGAEPVPDEDVPNHGEAIPGGAMIVSEEPINPNAPAQEKAINAYQNLINYFNANYGQDHFPDWYGGAYVTDNDFLIICVVEENVPERYMIDAGGDKTVGKEFYLQIQKWANSTAIGFSDAKYSYNYLRNLQKQVCALPELSGLGSWGCGVDEMENLVGLDVPQADDALLAALAVLDPDDDAIRVTTGVYIGTAEAAMSGMDGDPAGYSP